MSTGEYFIASRSRAAKYTNDNSMSFTAHLSQSSILAQLHPSNCMVASKPSRKAQPSCSYMQSGLLSQTLHIIAVNDSAGNRPAQSPFPRATEAFRKPPNLTLSTVLIDGQSWEGQLPQTTQEALDPLLPYTKSDGCNVTKRQELR